MNIAPPTLTLPPEYGSTELAEVRREGKKGVRGLHTIRFADSAWNCMLRVLVK